MLPGQGFLSSSLHDLRILENAVLARTCERERPLAVHFLRSCLPAKQEDSQHSDHQRKGALGQPDGDNAPPQGHPTPSEMRGGPERNVESNLRKASWLDHDKTGWHVGMALKKLKTWLNTEMQCKHSLLHTKGHKFEQK